MTAPTELDDADAIEKALVILREHGIGVSSPRDGDLDDCEQERFNGVVDAFRAYLSALPATEAGWRDMESAPRDGTNILAAHETAAIVVNWQEDRTVDGAPGWADGETDLDGYFYTYPVFVWQPLPPLPAAPDRRAGE